MVGGGLPGFRFGIALILFAEVPLPLPLPLPMALSKQVPYRSDTRCFLPDKHTQVASDACAAGARQLRQRQRVIRCLK